MQSDLKKKLFSNVLLSTKSERVSLKLPSRPAPSLASLLSTGAAITAAAGLALLLIAKLKPFF